MHSFFLNLLLMSDQAQECVLCRFFGIEPVAGDAQACGVNLSRVLTVEVALRRPVAVPESCRYVILFSFHLP